MQNNNEKIFFKKTVEQTPHPNLLDVVKIDGRFAQVLGGGNYIKYLDDKSISSINWEEYFFKKFTDNNHYRDKLYVSDLLEKKLISFEEYMSVHWNEDKKEDIDNKRNVIFFGIYKKK